MSFFRTVETQWMPAIALDNADSRWGSTISHSFLGRAWEWVHILVAAPFESKAAFGTLLQQLGFAVAVLLFVLLPTTRYVDDKIELAFIIATGYGLRLLGTLLAGRERYRPSAIDGIVLLYFAIHLVASFSSHYLKESLFGLGKYLVYLFAYFLFVWSLQHQTNRRVAIMLTAVLLAALAVSLYGLYQYKVGVAPLATWEDPSIEDKTTRIYATLKNPNLLAGYLVPMIPLSFGMGMAAWFSKGWVRWFATPFLGAAGIIGIATFLTGSRGAWIALAFEAAALLFVAAVWVWKTHPKLRWSLFLAPVLVALAAVAALQFHLLPPSYEHRITSIFAGAEHSSNAYRMNVYRASFNMLKDNWWIGIGSGNKTFVLAYGLYMKSGFDALGTYSVPLEIGVETGLPGLLAFGWLLVALGARAHRRFWNNADVAQRWVALASMVAIIGMMGHGLFDTVFYRPQVQFVFWLAVAIIVALPKESTKQ